jgi:hypothetical protein
MKKPKPTITPIIISADNLEFLKKKLDDPNLSQYLKRRFIREIALVCPLSNAQNVSAH